MSARTVPRVYPDDPSLRPQTLAHHLARYRFAAVHLQEARAARAGANGAGTNSGVVLDLMCGSGYGSDILRRCGVKVLGVDADAEAIAYARRTYPDGHYIARRAEEIGHGRGSAPTGRFSHIVWFEGIEHVTKPEGRIILERCYHALAPLGTLLLSTPRDMNAKYNPWHKSEWTLSELVHTALLDFEHVETFGQDWDTGEIRDAAVVGDDFYILVCRRVVT